MNRLPVNIEVADFPEVFHPLLRNCQVYDSSCFSGARVYYLDRDDGLYLKVAEKGSLGCEAVMTRYFHKKGLCPQVLSYESLEKDWMLTRKISGEDCTHQMYLDEPKRLSALLGELLRQLHEAGTNGCPKPDLMDEYVENARLARDKGQYDLGWYSPTASLEEVWRIVEETAPILHRNTLIHGDYCLPNVMLDNWNFSGFLDVGAGGLGDRHFDLFWGCWSLEYNLHSKCFRDRFLDAYGRDLVDEEMLRRIPAFVAFG